MKPLYIQKQSGVALFVSLIMLLLLTIIGITSMKSTILEEKMAGNMINRGLAFQAAESALRGGENYLRTNAGSVTFSAAGTNGLYDSSVLSVAILQPWSSVDWADDAKIIRLGNNTLQRVAEQPGYIVEELPSVVEDGNSLETGVASEANFYRVTSRGVGGTDTAVVMLQSTYKR